MWGFLQAPSASSGILGTSGKTARVSSLECWDAQKLPLLELAPTHKQRPAALPSLRSRSSSCSRVTSPLVPCNRENSSLRLHWPPNLNHICFSKYDTVLRSAAKYRATSWSSVCRGNLTTTSQNARRQKPATSTGRLDDPGSPVSRRQRKSQSRSPPPGSAKLTGLQSGVRGGHSLPAERSVGRALQAMQGDKDFQRRTLQQFVEESDEYCRSLATSVIKRQEGQFFNFLCDASEHVLKSDAKDIIPTAMKNFDFLQGESSIKGQESKTAHSIEFTPRELSEVRNALKSYAQASSPLQVVTHWVGSHADADLLFRPTFCRFILDSRLVSETVNDGRVPYHHAVTIFDKFASPLRSNLSDCSPQTHGALRLCPTSLLEDCVVVIALLIEQSQNPLEVSRDFFNEGLPQACRIADALLAEASMCAEQAAEEAVHYDTAQARKQRRMDILVHVPPRFCDWTAWIEGMLRWIEAFDSKHTPTAVAERCQQQLALKCFLDDVLVEPGCLHVCSVFHSLFVELFETYHDERRKRHDGKLCEDTYEPHMSRAAFFRFCLDLQYFPKVCSFDEVLLAYDEAECLTYLGKKITPTEKWRRSSKKILKLIQYLRYFGLLRWSGKGKSSHAASTSDLHVGDQSKRHSRYDCKYFSRENQVSLAQAQSGESHSQGDRSRPSTVHQQSRPSSKDNIARRSQRIPSVGSTQEMPPLALSKEHTWLLGELNCRTESSPEAEGGSPMPVPLSRRRRSFCAAGRQEHSDYVEDAANLLLTSAHKTTRGPSTRQSRRISASAGNTSQVKSVADLKWISEKFVDMTDLQRQLYALLRALAHCTVERFLNVKELFNAIGEDGDTGILDSSSFSRALSHAHVEHEFDELDICACMSIISPRLDGKMDMNDLEKAVGQVRDDMQHRRLAETSEEGGSFTGGLTWNASTSLGKQTWIDSVPCRSSHREFNRKHNSTIFEEHVFGCAAFMESMLRLTIWHMHKSGVAIKATSTGGMKALWMIIFLRYQFQKILKMRRSVEMSIHSDASTCIPDSIQPISFTKTVSETLERKDTLSTVRSCFSEDRVDESAGECVEDPPSGARFVSSKERLVAKEMLILRHFAVAGPDDDDLLTDARLDGECSHCGHFRSAQGIGNVFCDACSGVDDVSLSSHILFPILERRRFRSEARLFAPEYQGSNS